MKPLCSPIVEYRLLGSAEVAGGVVLGVVSVLVGRAGAALAGWLIGTVIFAGLMSLVFARRAREAVREAPPAPAPDREPSRQTRARVARMVIPQYVVMVVLVAVFPSFGFIGGIVAGGGISFLVVSARLRTWEHEHQVALLREPRYRWGWQQGGGFGRGILDPRDFYIAPTGA